MIWNANYPEAYRFLDDEHAMLVRKVQDMKNPSGGIAETDLKSGAVEFLDLLRKHFEHENRLMQQINYPESEVHKLYHETSLDNVETILRFFDHDSAQRHREGIANHLENRLAEELFFDRLLVNYLRKQDQ